MINPVTGSAPLGLSKPVGRVTTAADNAALLSTLTSDDWDLAGTAVGRTLDRSSQAQPLLLWKVALDRQSGKLASGQPVTVNYLKILAAGQTNQGFVNRINGAIDYLLAGDSSKACLDLFA